MKKRKPLLVPGFFSHPNGFRVRVWREWERLPAELGAWRVDLLNRQGYWIAHVARFKSKRTAEAYAKKLRALLKGLAI